MWDVLIVGGRCAGSPLAMLLARAGLQVLLVDRVRFPADTVSTHFIPTRGTALLRRWGLIERLAATGCPPIGSMLLDYGGVRLRDRPDAVEGEARMYAPRRTHLDHLLLRAAEESGATIWQETVMTGLLRDGDQVVGARLRGADGGEQEVRARIVIGADGMNSKVAREAGAEFRRHVDTISGGYFAYWRGVARDSVEFYMRKDRLILAFPTHDELACVYVGWPRAEFDAYQADVEANHLATVQLAPDLAQRMATGQRETPFRGTGRLPNFYRQAWGSGWALVGDAAYHRDPTTGMGISDAMLGASLLAPAIVAGLRDPSTMAAAMTGYQETLERQTGPLFELTLRSARFSDPRPLWDFYAGVAQDAGETRRLFNAVAGVVPFTEVFNAENLKAWSRLGKASRASS